MAVKIKDLSPKAWEAAKYQAEDKGLRNLGISDANRDGNYETGEAYKIAYDSGEITRASSGAVDATLVTALETFAASLSTEDLSLLEKDGKDLRILLGGSCKGNPENQCDASDIKKAAIRLSSERPQEILRNYAEPLVKAAQLKPDNMDIAFAAGTALYVNGDYELAVSYLSKVADTFANLTDAKITLVMAAAANGDVETVKARLTGFAADQKDEIKAKILLKVDEALEDKDVVSLLGYLYTLKEVFAEDLSTHENWLEALPENLSVVVSIAKQGRERHILAIDQGKEANVQLRVDNMKSKVKSRAEEDLQATWKATGYSTGFIKSKEGAKTVDSLAQAVADKVVGEEVAKLGGIQKLAEALPKATVKEGPPVAFLTEVQTLKTQIKTKKAEDEAVAAAEKAFHEGKWDAFNTALGQIQDQAKKDGIWAEVHEHANGDVRKKDAAGVLKALYFFYKGGVDVSGEATYNAWIGLLAGTQNLGTLVSSYNDAAFQQQIFTAVDKLFLDEIAKASQTKDTGSTLALTLMFIKLKGGYDKLSADQQTAVSSALKALDVRQIEAALKADPFKSETDFVAKVKEVTGAGKRRAAAPAAANWGGDWGGGSTPSGGGGSDW